MREPTPEASLYEWWRAATAGERVPVHEDEPQCGLFKRRIAPRGPFIPASIYVVREVDEESGELLSDERLACEVNGHPRDPQAEWLWLAKNPITQDDYDDLTILAKDMTDACI